MGLIELLQYFICDLAQNQKSPQSLGIRLALSSHKDSNMSPITDPISKSLRRFAVYKFSCARYNSVYFGEKCRYFSTRIRRHMSWNKNSHIYGRFISSNSCKQLSSKNCFVNLDSAKSSYQLEMIDSLHINCFKPFIILQDVLRSLEQSLRSASINSKPLHDSTGASSNQGRFHFIISVFASVN